MRLHDAVVRCPCCDRTTLPSNGQYELCPICWWEDDPHDRDRPSAHSGPNGISLHEGRDNYRLLGAASSTDLDSLSNVAKARTERLSCLWRADSPLRGGTNPTIVSDSSRKQRRSLREVHLVSTEQWADLSPLIPHKDVLNSLRVDAPLRDISLVNELTNLEELSVGPRLVDSGAIDLGRLPQLRALSLEQPVPVMGIPGAALTWLALSRPDPEWNDILASLSGVASVVLIEPTELPHAFPPSMETLDISHVPDWPQDWVPKGIQNVTSLRLTDIHGIENLRSFAAITHLEEFSADDCSVLKHIDGPTLAEHFTARIDGL